MDSIFGVLVKAAESERGLVEKKKGRQARRAATRKASEARRAEQERPKKRTTFYDPAREKRRKVQAEEDRERAVAAKEACFAKWKEKNRDCTQAGLYHMASPDPHRTRWALFTQVMGATRAQRLHMLKIIGIDVEELINDRSVDLTPYAQIMGIPVKERWRTAMAMRKWVHRGPSARAWSSLWE